jgi:hypothetical protein
MTLAIRIKDEQWEEQQEALSQPHRRWVTVKAEAGGWSVRLEGSRRVERFPTVTQAIHRGSRLARQHKPSGLHVRYVDGDEERFCYEPPEEP